MERPVARSRPLARAVATTANDAAVGKRPRGRPRKTALDRDDGNRRQELLRSAARLFRRKGFHATIANLLIFSKRPLGENRAPGAVVGQMAATLGT